MTFGRLASPFVAAAAFLVLPSTLFAQVQISQVLSGLTQPVFVGHAGDGTNRMFIVERPGRIRVVQPGSTSATVFLDISSKLTSSGGEQGLLGLAFHPQFETNGRFFVFYTKAVTGALVIAEYGASSNANVANTLEKPLLEIPHPTFTNHNGGMLAFGPDGYLYIGVGDGGSSNDPSQNAQNKDSLLGKILRIDINTPGGFVPPPSNPFYGGVAGRDEVFAFGLRNPWRFSFDRVTGQMWLGDVGQGTREEIDSPIVGGGNYGWRVFEGTSCTGNGPAACTPANYRAPVIEYGHGGGRCSVTGGYVYRGLHGALPPGTYVFGDYCTGEIFARTSGAPVLLIDTNMNLSSFGEDEAGEIYVVNFTGGTIGRLAGKGCTTPQPASDWVCVKGDWLPPGMIGGGTTAPPPPGCTTPQPDAGWTCMNGNWIAPSTSGTCTTTKPASDWVCVKGDWLPPGMIGGGTTPPPPPGCTTQQPGAGWTCVNGIWIAPSTSGTCTTTKPASDWVCVKGDWLPPAMVPGGGSTGGGTAPPPPPSSLPVCTNSTGAPGSGWVKILNGDWVPPTHNLALSSGVCRAP